MITPDRALAIVLSYFAVACIAWTHGYLTRVLLERRATQGEALFATPPRLIDLTSGGPYDWQIDGECVRQGAR